MSEAAGGFCITCPRCGQVHQKGFATDSIIVCMACGYQFYAYLNRGLLIEMPASHVGEEAILSRMRDFVIDVGKAPTAYPYDHAFQDYAMCQREIEDTYGAGEGPDDEEHIIRIIKKITGRGHNAEVRRRSDGTLAVYEVKKNIAI